MATELNPSPVKRELFLGVHKLPVSSATIARWIKNVLEEAGMDPIFSAHSTRGAAASNLFILGISMGAILRQGDWSRRSTFSRFYHRQIEA